MEPYRAVVIGCGRIGSAFSQQARAPGVHSHAQAYRENPRTRLVGLCDVDAGARKAAEAAWGVGSEASAAALCRRERPDVVSVCTPDAAHLASVEEVLAAHPPRLLFVEKPLALTTLDADRLLAAARRAGTTVAVNHTRRFVPAFRTVREELAAGLHGAPRLARVLYGKGLIHNGVHALDLLRFWLGDPVEARGRATEWGPDGDATWDAEFRFATGARAVLTGSDARTTSLFEFDLLCERSRVRFWAGGDAWEFSVLQDGTYEGYATYVPTDRAQRDTRFQRPLAGALGHAVQNLVEHLDGGAPLLCTGDDGLAALRMVEAVRGAA